MEKKVRMEPRTLSFIKALSMLKDKPSNAYLANVLGIKTVSTISEIKGQRQNIQPDSWQKFIDHYKSEISELSEMQEQKFIVEQPEGDFFGLSTATLIAVEAALKVITKKLIEAETRRTKKDKKIVSQEFHKAMKEEYNLLLQGLQKK